MEDSYIIAVCRSKPQVDWTDTPVVCYGMAEVLVN